MEQSRYRIGPERRVPVNNWKATVASENWSDTPVERLGPYLFRRHVAWRTQNSAGAGLVRGRFELGDSEVR